MRPIKIVTDSCCDLPAPYRGKFDLSYLLFNLVIKGVETPAGLDLTNEEYHDFYDGIRYGGEVHVLPATELTIRNKFQKHINDGKDILYVACSADQSKSVTKAKKIAEEMMKRQPDVRIEVFDSGSVSFGEGLLAIKACEHRDAGMNMDEILEALHKDRVRVLQFLTVESVVYMARSGTITARTESFDRLMDLHPIIIADKNGKQETLCRIRGFKNAVDKIIDLFAMNVVEPEKQHIFIAHGDEPELGEYVKKALEEKGIHPHRFHVECMGTEVGARVGPQSIAIFGFGKEEISLGE